VPAVVNGLRASFGPLRFDPDPERRGTPGERGGVLGHAADRSALGPQTDVHLAGGSGDVVDGDVEEPSESSSRNPPFV
jgi:hypothetical protein